MTTITTNPNLIAEIDYTFSGDNKKNNRWEIHPVITYRVLITGEVQRTDTRIITIVNTPPQDILNEEGEVTGITPEGTELTEFLASFDGLDSLREVTINKIIERRNVTEWDGTIIDDIENDPNAEEVKWWADVIGTLVAPPNRIDYNGAWYDVKLPHLALAHYTPNIANTLYEYSAEQPSPGGSRPAWEPQTYALDAEVSHNNKAWKNRRANNNQQFAPGTDGSGWMEITEDGELIGSWYNLGSEGYPTGYIAIGSPCYVNNNPNNTFGPTVWGWATTNCP